jgi:hypothetical protein
MEEKLVLVTTNPDGRISDATDFLHVDWGPEFERYHAMGPYESAAGFSVNLGPLALSYILLAGGSGYFRMRAVKPEIDAGRLHFVPGTPQFSYPVYVVYSADSDDTVLSPALAGLRRILDV